MRQHTFYRIINLFILALAAYLAINVLMSIVVSLTNPMLLLVEFVLACIPIYAFTSNYFFNRGIKNAQPCNPKLKDWIKVNAYVSFIFAVFMFLGCLMLATAMNDPKMLQQIKDGVALSSPTQIPEGDLVKYLKVMVYVFLPFSALLLIHIVITLRLLKKYNRVFDDSSSS
jgi:hypothetical protein